MHIEHEIELLGAQLLQELSQSAQALPRALAHRATIELYDRVEIGMPLEQRGVTGIDDPSQVSAREAFPNSRKKREAVNHVAEGAGLDQRNALRLVVRQRHS